MDYEQKYKYALDRAVNLFVTNNISATAACEIFPELNKSEEINYEKKYKEALEEAKKLYGKYCINNVLEDLFPELKEIEDKDEMIRQCLIEHIKCNKDLNWSLFQWFKPDTIIAWLEEQGKNKKLDADKVIAWLKNNLFDDIDDGHFWSDNRNIIGFIEQFKKDFEI